MTEPVKTWKGRVIRTTHVFPPIPDRHCDWRATFDGYEPGEPIGYGETEEAAIQALLDRTEERES